MTQAVQPTPKDLIQRWEGYHFMFPYEMILNEVVRHDRHDDLVLVLSPRMLCVLQTKMSGLSLISPADCRQFLAQSPEFVRIFQARWLLQQYVFRPHSKPSFYHIRLLLDLSWDDITAAFLALRSLIGGATRKQIAAVSITILALSLELYPSSISSLTSDLARGCLHLIQQIGAGDLPIHAW